MKSKNKYMRIKSTLLIVLFAVIVAACSKEEVLPAAEPVGAFWESVTVENFDEESEVTFIVGLDKKASEDLVILCWLDNHTASEVLIRRGQTTGTIKKTYSRLEPNRVETASIEEGIGYITVLPTWRTFKIYKPGEEIRGKRK